MFGRQPVAVERARQAIVVEAGPGEGMLHHEPPRCTQDLVVDVVRHTQRRAGVACRRLDEDFLEVAVWADLAIEGAVEADTPCEA